MTHKKNILDNILTVTEYIVRRLNGESDDKIAKAYFVSHRTLKRWKAKMGVGTSFINQQRSFIIEDMHQQGKTWVEIGRVLNLTELQCRNIYKQFLKCG